MFRGLWRALRGEPEELLALEIVITVAIIAIPLFFAPVIPITPGLPNQERSEQAAEENQPVIESIFAWSIFRAERFIHGYKDDLIAVFTIVLAWSTIGLWIVTERTLRHAESSSERQLRAYCFFVSCLRQVSHSPKMEFEFVVKNTGSTPAYKTKILLGGKFGLASEDIIPSFQSGEKTEFAIGPRQKIINYHRMEASFSTTQMEQIAAGTYVYFIRGRIEYADAFGIDRHTETIVAYGKESIVRGALQICTHGNHAN